MVELSNQEQFANFCGIMCGKGQPRFEQSTAAKPKISLSVTGIKRNLY